MLKEPLPPAQGLPAFHNPALNGRTLIEVVDGWRIYGSDRQHASYCGHFERGETPLQLLYGNPRLSDALPRISIITPCRGTAGKFEYVFGECPPVRVCCYTCVRKRLERTSQISLPQVNDWIVYMLLETASYMTGPAPQERSYGQR